MVLMRFASFKRQETAKNAPKCDPKKLNAFLVIFVDWRFLIIVTLPSHTVPHRELKTVKK